jgi:hypothetical protein
MVVFGMPVMLVMSVFVGKFAPPPSPTQDVPLYTVAVEVAIFQMIHPALGDRKIHPGTTVLVPERVSCASHTAILPPCPDHAPEGVPVINR